MDKSKRVLGILAVFGIAAATAYWIYLYISTGSAPSFSDLWSSGSGMVTGLFSKQSFSDLQTLASNAGFSGDDANTAAAIALAESGGNPSAIGDVDITPGGSIGLWQINLKAHPEYNATQLKDPATNAAAAFSIYQAAGNAFTPWSTFNSGAYEAHLPAPTATPDDGTVAQVTPADSGVDSSASSGASQNTIYGSSEDV
jgi:hypothetical protein